MAAAAAFDLWAAATAATDGVAKVAGAAAGGIAGTGGGEGTDGDRKDMIFLTIVFPIVRHY